MRVIDPAVSLLIVLLIGIVAGLIFDRVARPRWFSREVANEMRGMVTLSLIGIAGAFIGFHLAILIFFPAGGVLVPFLGAMIGAVAVLAGWRYVR
jgi:uncharacterized membrane protein YeaQ/YmgE (transglycosylase-associated protein family)